MASIFYPTYNDRNRQVTDQMSRAIHFIAVSSEVASMVHIVIIVCIIAIYRDR